MLSLVLAVALVATLAGSVAAAAPVNDDRVDATVVTSLPFLDEIDNSEATVEPDDPDGWEGEKPVNATVWYSFTPATDGRYGVTTAGSSYIAAVLVATPAGGGILDTVRSSWVWNKVPGVTWPGRAGQRYLIMVAAWGTAGGPLVIQMRKDPPVIRFPKFTVVAEGKLTRHKGAAIRGRLTCRNVESRPWVWVDVKQVKPGRPKVKGWGSTAAPCGKAWRAVAWTNRGFRTGKVTVSAGVGAYNDWDWEQGWTKRTVTLK